MARTWSQTWSIYLDHTCDKTDRLAAGFRKACNRCATCLRHIIRASLRPGWRLAGVMESVWHLMRCCTRTNEGRFRVVVSWKAAQKTYLHARTSLPTIYGTVCSQDRVLRAVRACRWCWTYTLQLLSLFNSVTFVFDVFKLLFAVYVEKGQKHAVEYYVNV